MIRIKALSSIPYPGVVLALCLGASFSIALMSQGLGALFPFIQDDLDTTRAQLGLIASGWFIGTASTVLFAGWLTDVIGARRMRSVSFLALAGGLLLFSQIHSVVQGLLAGILIGIWVSADTPSNTKAIMDWVALRVRAMSMGANEAAISLSGIISAIVLTFLAVSFGWRVGVIVIAIVIAATGLLFFAFYRDKPGSYGGVDKTVNPLSRLPQVLRNRSIWLIAAFGTTIGSTHLVLIAYLVLFLKDDLGMSSGEAGGLLAIFSAGGTVGRLGWGMASDLLFQGGRMGILTTVGLLTGITLALMALLPSNTSLPLVGALVFAVGVLALGRSGVYVVLMAESAGPALTGTAMGLQSTLSFMLGIGLTPLFGLLVDRTGTYALSWWMMTAFVGAGVVLLAFVRAPSERQ